MAFDTVGGHSFISVRGPMTRNATESEPVTRPYTDGVGIRQTRIGCPIVEWRCVRDTTTQAFAEAFYVQYMLLKGTLVTAVRRGITYTNYYVWDVEEGEWLTGARGVGGIANGQILFETIFKVQYAGPVS